MRRRLWLWRCAWQGWRARRRGDWDMGVNDPYGRFVMSRAAVERLADDLANGRVKRRKVRRLDLDERSARAEPPAPSH